MWPSHCPSGTPRRPSPHLCLSRICLAGVATTPSWKITEQPSPSHLFQLAGRHTGPGPGGWRSKSWPRRCQGLGPELHPNTLPQASQTQGPTGAPGMSHPPSWRIWSVSTIKWSPSTCTSMPTSGAHCTADMETHTSTSGDPSLLTCWVRTPPRLHLSHGPSSLRLTC